MSHHIEGPLLLVLIGDISTSLSVSKVQILGFCDGICDPWISMTTVIMLIAGITALWALAASLVPAMQKGNDAARNLHIALNTLNVLLFVSQIPTGIDIVFKVFEFTNWPWMDSSSLRSEDILSTIHLAVYLSDRRSIKW